MSYNTYAIILYRVLLIVGGTFSMKLNDNYDVGIYCRLSRDGHNGIWRA